MKLNVVHETNTRELNIMIKNTRLVLFSDNMICLKVNNNGDIYLN